MKPNFFIRHETYKYNSPNSTKLIKHINTIHRFNQTRPMCELSWIGDP